MTSKNWVYILEAENYGRLILESLPDGWEDKKISIKRSPTYSGLFREFNAKLRFPKDGMEYLQEIYEEKGTEYKINIGIYEYNPPPIDKYLLYFSGLIDLSTYKFNENYVECDITESSLARKFMSRDDVKVNLNSVESIEGVQLDPIDKVNVSLHQREIALTAKYEIVEPFTVKGYRSSVDTNIRGFSLPMKKIYGDLDNLRDPVNPIIDTPGCVFWINSDNKVETYLNIKGRIVGIMGIPPTDTSNINFSINFRKYTDSTTTVFTDEPDLWSFTGELETQPIVDIDFDVQISNITPDNVIALIFQCDNANQSSFWCEFSIVSLDLTVLQEFQSSEAKGYLLHESAKHICEMIADRKNVFFSDLLGRLDIGYPADGNTSLQTIHSGQQVRAIPDKHLATSLSDFYKSLNAQHSIGIGIEYNAFNKPFIRLEKKDYFFSGEVIATIHGVTNIEKSVAREWIYNDIVVGYLKSEEYDESTGAEEYNNKFNWSTSIGTIKNKLDLTSKYRGDGYGIEYARRIQFSENPNADTKYDQDIFTIIVEKDGNKYLSVKDQNYDLVENIFSPETAYNLDITPGRMLRANGATIRAGLEKYLDKDIKFQYAEQKQNLRSRKIGGKIIEENDDFKVSELNQSFWVPELYTFDSILSRELLAKITKNPNGIIKFSTVSKNNTVKYYYGFIIEVNGTPEKEGAEWVLLRVNLDNPNLILIDPDGDTPEIPPIQPPDETIEGVFEGPFEFIFSG